MNCYSKDRKKILDVVSRNNGNVLIKTRAMGTGVVQFTWLIILIILKYNFVKIDRS